MSRAEMDSLGWGELDILLVSGDAYVDHPSFGMAILGRWLVSRGFRTGLVCQPRWTSAEDLKAMGAPRLFCGVTAGAMDSMLAHYTAFRKKRSDDAYTPGGLAGARPNRASIVYASLARQAFGKTPIVMGGIEASLRRITHYDFWTEKLRRPIILDAKADLVLYGMSESAIVQVAQRLSEGQCLVDAMVNNACYFGKREELPSSAKVVELPSHEEISGNPKALVEATRLLEQQVLHENEYAIFPVEGRTLILTPPLNLEGAELDEVYGLPYQRAAHPRYKQPIPAVEMIRYSINSHRGCAGGCSFCALALHQGRTIRSRSEGSILKEAAALGKQTSSISDVGGPSANMWGGYCAGDHSTCQRASCLFPAICEHFKVNQSKNIDLLKKVKQTPGIKHVRVASGIRYDLALKDENYIRELARDFVGGQLKIAPEHLSDEVLKLMRKPGKKLFERFVDIFEQESQKAGKPQFIIPYLLTAFPGCTDKEMRELTDWLNKRGWQPQQVQCFIPLPGTMAGAMFYSGVDWHGKPVKVAKTDAERMRQHYQLVKPEGERPRHADFKGGRGSQRRWKK